MAQACYRFIAMLTLALSLPAIAGTSITREDAEDLMAECQAQRETRIAPLRQEAIEDCLARGQGSRENCERRNTAYGQRSVGGSRIGMFWDLPVCGKALEAEQYFRRYPGRQSYSPDWAG